MVTGKRMRAEDRKRLILQAAIEEYGRNGLQETSTEVIAERAGVSQPYLFRLFGTKVGLITAAIDQHTDHMCDALRAAVEAAPDVDPVETLCTEYARLLEEDANSLRCQLHGWAASGSHPEIGAAARAGYLKIMDLIRSLTDADEATVHELLAYATLMTVAAALDIPELACLPPSLSPQDG